eukprot:1155807-Pelagomonas_calceolata.AAC.4
MDISKRSVLAAVFALLCSCKHQHQHRSMDKSMKHMVQTMQILHQQASAHSLLLVSGGGKRLKQFEACQVLDQLHPKEPTYGRLPLQLPIHCAFNPYLEGEAAAEERQRLQKKLQAGVAGVYLQIGRNGWKLRQTWTETVRWWPEECW